MKLEKLGTRVLRRLLPEIPAAACGWHSWPKCWQCAGSPCSVNTCTGKLVCK